MVPAGPFPVPGTMTIATEQPQTFTFGDPRVTMVEAATAPSMQGTMAGGYTVAGGQGGQAFMEPVATTVPVDAGTVQAGFTTVSGHPCQVVATGPSPLQTATSIQVPGSYGTQAVQGAQVLMEPVAASMPVDSTVIQGMPGNFASMAG